MLRVMLPEKLREQTAKLKPFLSIIILMQRSLFYIPLIPIKGEK